MNIIEIRTLFLVRHSDEETTVFAEHRGTVIVIAYIVDVPSFHKGRVVECQTEFLANILGSLGDESISSTVCAFYCSSLLRIFLVLVVEVRIRIDTVIRNCYNVNQFTEVVQSIHKICDMRHGIFRHHLIIRELVDFHISKYCL